MDDIEARIEVLKHRLYNLTPIRITERAGLRVEIAELEKQVQAQNDTPSGAETESEDSLGS